MSRPQYFRRPSGKAKGNSIVDKEHQAAKVQHTRRAELLARMRVRLAPPAPAGADPGGDGG